MNILASYPVIVTPDIGACRRFYVDLLGFDIVFEASWFVYLQLGTVGIAFMSPDHPSTPPGPETFAGSGVFLTLQVSDAALEFQRLRDLNASLAYPLRDEPWGQRRFALIDPAGVWLDIVEQTEPAPGFWDPYISKEQP
jgi:catechol 2,3-dioxygenase-like lactoylglutathione lyase family enzyme